uniref:Uncharacterized protein n=1 Tax=Arundo donax TaxID=35708 RepID=A0A0A9G4C6_ARUDO
MEQEVRVTMKTMLFKVMMSLKAQVLPVFKCIILGKGVYKVCVELDVSCCWFSVGNTDKVARIEGDHCASRELAETCAARKAFEYLARRHLVYYLAYSSNLAKKYADNDTTRHVSATCHCVESVMNQWDIAMDNLWKFQRRVEEKSLQEKYRGNAGVSIALYDEVVALIDPVISLNQDKLSRIQSEMKACEVECSKCWDEENE